MTLPAINISHFLDGDPELEPAFAGREKTLDAAEKILGDVEAGIFSISDGAKQRLVTLLDQGASQDLNSVDTLSDSLLGKELTEADMKAFIADHGFQHIRRGTYTSPSLGVYLYEKNDYEADSLEAAQKKIEVLRFLSEKGILHPGLRWHYYQLPGGTFQIFALGKSLVEIKKGAGNTSWQSFLTHKKVVAESEKPVDQFEYWANLLTREDSHITSWLRRLEPDYDPQKGMQSPSGKLLNIVEAFREDNWAWDPDSGILYPIDIEVVRIENVQ